MKKYRNVFERWQDGNLPEKLQERIDTVFQQGCKQSESEGFFKAGFILALEYDNFREELQNG